MEGPFAFLLLLFLGGGVASNSVRIINQSDEALVETLGRYNGKKLNPGLNFTMPFVERVVYKQTVRERVLDVPPQQYITRDNVSISVDAVVYWRIVDLGKSLLQSRESSVGDGEFSPYSNSLRDGQTRA